MDKIPTIVAPLFFAVTALYFCVKTASGDRTVANIIFAILFMLVTIVAVIALAFALR